MGAGIFVNVSNASNTPATITIQFAGMTVSGNENPPSQSLALGAYQRANQFYAEEQPSNTSSMTFQVSVGTQSATIQISEGDESYSIQSNSNPGLASVDLVNADTLNFDSGDVLQQAWLAVMVRPAASNATWMTNWTDLGQLPLSQICLPGVHDSGCWTIASGEYGGDLVAGEVLTQTSDIAGQLANGARFFDVRPGGPLNTTNLLQSTLYHVHCPSSSVTICCGSYSDMLSDFATFAAANPNEIIVILLSHFQTNTPGQDQTMVLKSTACQMAYNALGAYMVPNSTSLAQTLSAFRGANPGKNVFVIVDTSIDGIPMGGASGAIVQASNGADVSDLFYTIANYGPPSPPLNNWSQYANTSDWEGVMGWVQSNVPGAQSSLGNTSFDLLQCQATPSATGVVSGYSNVTMAQQTVNPKLQQLLGMHMNPNSTTAQAFAQYGNIFQVDAFDGTATDLAIATNVPKIAAAIAWAEAKAVNTPAGRAALVAAASALTRQGTKL